MIFSDISVYVVEQEEGVLAEGLKKMTVEK
jgi:hypothetical protein